MKKIDIIMCLRWEGSSNYETRQWHSILITHTHQHIALSHSPACFLQ